MKIKILQYLPLVILSALATSHALATPESSESEKARALYGSCLRSAKVAATNTLSADEAHAVSMFRARLSHLVAIRGKRSSDSRFDYSVRLQALASEAEKLTANPKVFAKVTEALFDEKLEYSVQMNIGLQSPEWRAFKPIVTSIEMGGIGGSADKISRIAQNLLFALNRHFDVNSPLKKYGARVSLAEWETRRTETIMAFDIVFKNMIALRAAHLTTTDHEMQKHAALIRQLSVGAIGGAALAVALTYSGPAVTTSAAAGKLFLGSATAGELAGVAGVGALGGSASVAIEQSVEGVATAWALAGNNGTPFECELQRQIELHRDGELAQIGKGALTGTIAGSVLAGTSRLFPRAVMWLIGGAVVGSEAYEVGETAYSLYEIYKYVRMAEEAEDAQDRELAVELLGAARMAATEAATHAVDAIIVGILAKALFVEGEFREALHEGGKKIAHVIAMSSDEIPAAAQSAGNAGQAIITAAGIENAGTKSAKLAAKLLAAKAKAAKIAAAKAGPITDVVTHELKARLHLNAHPSLNTPQ
jgi:phosphohistidine swiveling domain-containing protein